MIGIIILLLIYFWQKPRIEYIQQSKMYVCWYGRMNRGYFIIWKE